MSTPSLAASNIPLERDCKTQDWTRTGPNEFCCLPYVWVEMELDYIIRTKLEGLNRAHTSPTELDL